ncbi:MAG: PIN domain-containing protein [Deltaproteobacteria bacterium]|nr:PIN domain-containing protein [Deltaproteobacteria bacterium]MBW2653149.1 PIN domain-containing protein [Deltaproteobacteria bacterium]MCK5104387.1 PIN domain-containing protein [Cyclobacteriaceae bacterium]MCK5186609.1 PIN domain-containing protein [Deltaproteobacteria bacterium]MCK5513957.1 PIN domain-containing protein [Deltaproteobacteria bacterium]
MSVLVDTSIWVKYFRNGNNLKRLDLLIDENLVVTNDLILAELLPFLKIRKQRKIVDLLNNVNKLQLRIKWDEIIDYQVKCLKKGVNGVGIPDLIIAQNAKQNDCEIYSTDKHFKLLKNIISIKITP